MTRLQELAITTALAVAVAQACGCDQNKPAHASSSAPGHPPAAEGLGFCSEDTPAPSASAPSCTCEAPAASTAVDAGASASKSSVIPSDSTQALLVTTPDWQAFQGKAQRYRREGSGPWIAEGALMAVAIGRKGMAWGRGLHPEGQAGPAKREGDMKSPAGVFELAGAYGYAAAPPPGASWPYRRLTVGWKCVDDPRNEAYNTFVLPEAPLAEAPIGASWDGTRRDVIFNMFVEVRQNASPVIASAGSCVLLHRWVNPVTPTQGCTSMSKDHVEAVLGWLSPKAHPVLIQMPAAQHASVASSWGLPAHLP